MKITINNSFSFLDAPEDIKDKIWSSLRFPIRNRYFNPFVQSRKWDGYVEFFKKKDGKFLTGLLPEVKVALKFLNKTFEEVDNRIPVEFKVKEIDKNFIDGRELRDYQVDYVNQLIKKQRGIIPAPTSAGKTLTIACMLKALKEKTPALILANRIDIIEQTYEELVGIGVENVGRFYGKKKDPNFITCSTVQSAKKLGPVLSKIRFLIIDEIHDMMTKQSKWVYSRIPNCSFRAGTSATPFKFGGTDFVQKYEAKGYIGPLLKTQHAEDGLLTTKVLQDLDILSKCNCWFLPIRQPILEYAIYTDAVTLGLAENKFLENEIVELNKRLKGRTLILVERIDQGDRLAEKLGNSVAWIKGSDNEETRKIVRTRLQKDENCVAIATRHIFNTGVNVFVHQLINAAGGSAEHMIIQRLGRGLRKAPDKEFLDYYDFMFYNNKDYLLKHSNKRVRILKKEGHNCVLLNNIEERFTNYSV